MRIHATLIAATSLALASGCSPSSGERAVASDQTSRAQAEPQRQPPPLPSPDEAKPAPPPRVAVRDLPPEKVIASVEAETSPQTKTPDLQNVVAPAPAPYHPLDLPASNAAARIAPFPQEVTNFMVERDSCDHFRGEEPYDAERRAYLAENIAELCTGTDGRLSALRMRYANDPAVTAALSGYDDRIESGTGNGKYIGK